jgi:acyl dehydratase
MNGYYFEDLVPGRQFDAPGATITEDAIIRFALEWDYQPFHVDRVAAKASMFGSLIASGLHTLLLSFRLCAERGLFREPAAVGLGVDKIRFHMPVLPGSTIVPRITVKSCRPSSTKPHLGVVVWDVVVTDDADRKVLSFSLTNLVLSRPALT